MGRPLNKRILPKLAPLWGAAIAYRLNLSVNRASIKKRIKTISYDLFGGAYAQSVLIAVQVFLTAVSILGHRQSADTQGRLTASRLPLDYRRYLLFGLVLCHIKRICFR